MNFLDRSINKLYKTYKECIVEYHAGGFFIRKIALYIFIKNNNSLIVVEKNEGLHPFDNEYPKLISEEFIKGKLFRLNYVSNNIATFSDGIIEVKVMPSVFAENYNDKKLTELLVDFGKDYHYIFFLIFDNSETLD
jgi:hypothetical protein